MTKTDKQALRHAAQEVVDESGESWFMADEFSDSDVPYTDAEFIAVAKPSAVLALLDENSRLAAERDALREGMEGSSTRLAADIYFQLIEECEIPPGGSLVEHIDNLKERIAELESEDNCVTGLNDELCKLLPGCQYMDPPDGGNITPFEQVSRMIADYRQQLEARTITVKLSDVRDDFENKWAEVHSGNRPARSAIAGQDYAGGAAEFAWKWWQRAAGIALDTGE